MTSPTPGGDMSRFSMLTWPRAEVWRHGCLIRAGYRTGNMAAGRFFLPPPPGGHSRYFSKKNPMGSFTARSDWLVTSSRIVLLGKRSSWTLGACVAHAQTHRPVKLQLEKFQFHLHNMGGFRIYSNKRVSKHLGCPVVVVLRPPPRNLALFSTSTW